MSDEIGLRVTTTGVAVNVANAVAVKIPTVGAAAVADQAKAVKAKKAKKANKARKHRKGEKNRAGVVRRHTAALR